MAKIWTRQMTNNLLSDIEDMDEEEAEYFFKTLAKQSHEHEVKAFIEGAK